MSLVKNDDLKRFEEMEKVVELYIQNVNPTKIAKELGIRRVDVLDHIEAWKTTAVGTELMQDRVQELIATMDEHYSRLIGKFYEVVAEVDENDYEHKGRAAMLAQKSNALKAIADLEAKRVDTLQKAGMFNDASIGDELVQMEEQKELLMTIMDEELCDDCKRRVFTRLSQYQAGQAVVIVHE